MCSAALRRATAQRPQLARMAPLRALVAPLLLLTTTTAMAPDSVIIGGSSGMGKAAAKACVRAGGRVLLASRDGDKLAAAQQEVIRDCDASQERVRTAVLDARDEAAVADFAAALDDGDYAGLVVSAAGRARAKPRSARSSFSGCCARQSSAAVFRWRCRLRISLPMPPTRAYP